MSGGVLRVVCALLVAAALALSCCLCLPRHGSDGADFRATMRRWLAFRCSAPVPVAVPAHALLPRGSVHAQHKPREAVLFRCNSSCGVCHDPEEVCGVKTSEDVRVCFKSFFLRADNSVDSTLACATAKNHTSCRCVHRDGLTPK